MRRQRHSTTTRSSNNILSLKTILRIVLVGTATCCLIGMQCMTTLSATPPPADTTASSVSGALENALASSSVSSSSSQQSQASPPSSSLRRTGASPAAASAAKQNNTEAELYKAVDLHGNSSTATVIGMAADGYELIFYQLFVGTLRESGFQGNIILGVGPETSPDILAYLQRHHVKYHIVPWADVCKHRDEDRLNDLFAKTKCPAAYPDLKLRWGRYPLARDWLQDCWSCTGPVLVTDVREALFQRDPFGAAAPVTGLQVFQEDPRQNTNHWLVQWPLQECLGVVYEKRPMLASGTVVGTRAAVLRYLDLMHAEMKQWTSNFPKCRFDVHGDDQAIHNHLYYSGKLPFAISIRHGGGDASTPSSSSSNSVSDQQQQPAIVHTMGVAGAALWKDHVAYWKARGEDANSKAYVGRQPPGWAPPELHLTNEAGFLVQFDGSVSRMVLQWDRLGPPFQDWLFRQEFVQKAVAEPPAPPPAEALMATEKAAVSLQAPEMQSAAATTTGYSQLSNQETAIDGEDHSLNATVMGMATGYELLTYQIFVGSLRKSGFKGNIILGVSPNVSEEVLAYFRYRNVTPKILQWVNCTYQDDSLKNDIFQKTHCAHPYPDIKIRWSRFPLARDWLRDCKECTGPVLITDVRDTLFQRNPFGPGSPAVTGLQVFEEHKEVTTQNWLTKWPIKECKGVEYHKPMLCSGTTVGTRSTMLRYLEKMYREMKEWISKPNCRFGINGDDQSIHNYLFYSDQLRFAKAIPYGKGGIVNTIGYPASSLLKRHKAYWAKYNVSADEAQMTKPYLGATRRNWIGQEFRITNEDGLIIEEDGSVSRVVHQWDRFGDPYYNMWLYRQDFVYDPMPELVWNQSSSASTPPTS